MYVFILAFEICTFNIYSRMCHVWVSDILHCSCAKSHLGMYEINGGGFFLVFLLRKMLSQLQFEQRTVRAPFLSEAFLEKYFCSHMYVTYIFH